MYGFNNGIYVIPRGFPEFPVSFRFGDQQPTLQETEAPGLVDIEMDDSGRSWSGNTQNCTLIFTEAVTLANTTGWSVTVNGTTKTLSYVSGTGTARIVFQINTVIHDADIVRFTYDPTVGATTSVTDTLEIKAVNGYLAEETLSRRVRFTLCDSLDANIASESVKAAILEYHGGVVADDISYGPRPSVGGVVVDAPGGMNLQWMARANVATVITDSSALFDMEYTGLKRAGDFVYVAIIRSNGESLLVRTAIV
jgi:hypothetical protein